VTRFLGRFVRNESGATAIEYALIASGISITIVALVSAIGTTLTNTFTGVNTKLNSG
jgi:pilus assembly protein Flp/PilA